MDLTYLTENINYTSNHIPKIIHQTWKDEEIPDHWKISNQKWKELHPDWKYMLWTDKLIDQYMNESHADYYDLFKKYPYNIQRVDMMRYFILYDFGGVYSDLDIYPLENIEPHIQDLGVQALFVFSANFSVFTNAFMISQKGSPIWLEVHQKLREKIPWWAFGKHLHVMTSTGPMMLDSVLRNSNQSYGVLPRLKFNACAENEIGDPKPGAVLHSLVGNSWHAFDSTLYNLINGNKVLFIILAVLIFILIIVFLIYFGIIYYRFTSVKRSKIIKYCNDPLNINPTNEVDLTNMDLRS